MCDAKHNEWVAPDGDVVVVTEEEEEEENASFKNAKEKESLRRSLDAFATLRLGDREFRPRQAESDGKGDENERRRRRRRDLVMKETREGIGVRRNF